MLLRFSLGNTDMRFDPQSAPTEGAERMRRRDLQNEGVALLESWRLIVSLLPDRHRFLINGPTINGQLTLSIINGQQAPNKAIVSFKDGTLPGLFIAAGRYLQEVYGTVVTSTKQPRVKGKFAKKDPLSNEEVVAVRDALQTTEGAARFDAIMDELGAKQPLGFTRDRDLVAYLIYKNAHVTQYELRHEHRIKNPAQAINDAERHYKFTMRTLDALPNGDIPYQLWGAVPNIEGTLPMFASAEDPDEKLYVLELDLYSCLVCGRHPVYRPQRTPITYAGVCPRHGPANFEKI